MLLWLLSAEALLVQSVAAISYSAVRSSTHGPILCATDPPAVTDRSSRSKLHCSVKCDQTVNCMSFNHKQLSSGQHQSSSVCEMFTGKPQSYASVTNCAHYASDAQPAAAAMTAAVAKTTETTTQKPEDFATSAVSAAVTEPLTSVITGQPDSASHTTHPGTTTEKPMTTEEATTSAMSSSVTELETTAASRTLLVTDSISQSTSAADATTVTTDPTTTPADAATSAASSTVVEPTTTDSKATSQITLSTSQTTEPETTSETTMKPETTAALSSVVTERATTTESFETTTHSTDGTSQTTPPETGVNAETDCWFPFTLSGQLHYQCVDNGTGVPGCFLQNGTWADCSPATIGYVAANVTVSVTIPTTSEVVSVRSVNDWIIIHSRVDSAYPVHRYWNDYVNGFGDPLSGNFWLGLERMHLLTTSANYTLRFEIQAAEDGKWYSAEYSLFYLNSATDNYRLRMSTTSRGELSEAFNVVDPAKVLMNGMMFSARDNDNDNLGGWVNNNCAITTGGGWWYDSCSWVNLNGDAGLEGGFYWHPLEDAGYPSFWHLQTSRMMIKQL